MAANPASELGARSWRAELDLELARVGERTRVASKRHSGPLCIQKPFYPGDGSCHIYLLHPPGGLAGGDELDVSLRLGTDAAALVTMPASTKFYRSVGAPSRLVNTLTVGAHAVLEWLPPETILFGGAHAEMTTRVELAAGARFIGWETLVLGRPLSGDHFRTGRFEQRLELSIEGRPVLLEHLQAQAQDAMLEAPWGLAGNVVTATLLAWPAERVHLDAVRAALSPVGGADDRPCGLRAAATSVDGRPRGPQVAATLVDGLLIVRALAQDVLSLRPLLDSSWQTLRAPLLGRQAVAPRIWNT